MIHSSPLIPKVWLDSTQSRNLQGAILSKGWAAVQTLVVMPQCLFWAGTEKAPWLHIHLSEFLGTQPHPRSCLQEEMGWDDVIFTTLETAKTVTIHAFYLRPGDLPHLSETVRRQLISLAQLFPVLGDVFKHWAPDLHTGVKGAFCSERNITNSLTNVTTFVYSNLT